MTLSASSVDSSRTDTPDRRTVRAVRSQLGATARRDDASAEISEIERVSSLLRRMQPDLVVRHESAAGDQPSEAKPTWLVVGVVWTLTIVLVALAAAAVVILVN
jgi:hypothetical protein